MDCKIIFFILLILTGSAHAQNVVVLLFDDLGAEVITADSIRAPNGTAYPVDMKYLRDSMPPLGLTFSNFYATPICSPSRIALLTGRGMEDSYHGFRRIHEDDRTTAQNAKWAGYNTAIVGKWQLDSDTSFPTVSTTAPGDSVVNRLGFDRWMLFQAYTSGNDRYSDPTYRIDGSNVSYNPTDYGPRITLDTVKALIDRWSGQDEPFYIQYMSALPHDPFEPPLGHPDFPNKQTGNGLARYYPNMCEYADSLVWELYSHLDDAGLLDETIFIVTTDNGTPDEPRPAPFYSIQPGGAEVEARKTWNDYLGTHVPAWVFYNGSDKAFTNGDTITELAQLEDIYATIAEITGNHQHDGISLMQYVSSDYPGTPRTVIRSWYNTYLQYSDQNRNGILEPRSLFHNGTYGYVKEDDEWFNLLTDPKLETPISQPGGADFIKTVADSYPNVTYVYPDVMKIFAE